MFQVRILATALFACAIAVPAFAQEPVPAEPADTVATAAPDGSTTEQLTVPPVNAAPQLPRVSNDPDGNPLKLIASDFKNFFSGDTGRTLSYTAIVAIAAAPWDREGVNNGFSIPTTVFQSGNVIGNFAFQVGAGFATYGVGKAFGNKQAAFVGRDIVRAQVVSQVLVQATEVHRPSRPSRSQQQQVVPVRPLGQRVLLLPRSCSAITAGRSAGPRMRLAATLRLRACRGTGIMRRT